MIDSDIAAQLDAKIQQLPPQFIAELNDYIDFLLQKSQMDSTDITNESLKYTLQKQQAILGSLDAVWDESDENAIEQVQRDINQWKIRTF
jgi:hypothetical protein